MPGFSDYEHGEARKIVQRKAELTTRQVKDRIPEGVRQAPRKAIERLRQNPAAAQALELATSGYEQALKGFVTGLNVSARASLRPQSVVRKYASRDGSVTEVRGIQSLDLEVIDAVRPRNLPHRYALAVGGEGALSGLAMSGGTVIAAAGSIFGAGAGAAPGAGVAAAAFAADTAAVLVGSARLTAETGLYYGYDPRDEFEQLFAGAVLNYGTAAGTAAKNAAYADLFRLTNMLARRAAFVDLNKSALTKLLRPLFQRLALRFTKMKLGQIVPVAGIVVGAGMNYSMIHHVGEVAHWAYRERFLRDKGYPFDDEPLPENSAGADADADQDEPVISVFQIADQEGIGIRPADDGTSGPTGSAPDV